MKMQVNRIAETIWEIPTTEKAGHAGARQDLCHRAALQRHG